MRNVCVAQIKTFLFDSIHSGSLCWPMPGRVMIFNDCWSFFNERICTDGGPADLANANRGRWDECGSSCIELVLLLLINKQTDVRLCSRIENSSFAMPLVSMVHRDRPVLYAIKRTSVSDRIDGCHSCPLGRNRIHSIDSNCSGFDGREVIAYA